MNGRYFKLRIVRTAFAGESYLFISRHEVTELRKLKRERSSLGSRLLHVQSDERRRLARDLHDSTGELLSALRVGLAQLKQAPFDRQASVALADCDVALKLVQREISTLSFVHHPPPLGQRGLGEALDALARGFAARTSLEISVMIGNLGEIPPAIEAAIYRLAQESLANIQRHARAKTVKLMLTTAGKHLQLSICDDGIGFEPNEAHGARLGVGVPSMRERVEERGGKLTISRLSKGTLVTARFPLAQVVASAA